MFIEENMLLLLFNDLLNSGNMFISNIVLTVYITYIITSYTQYKYVR